MLIQEKIARIKLASALSPRKAKVALGVYNSAENALRELNLNPDCDISFIDNCLVYEEQGYPSILKGLIDAPMVLYFRGDIKLLSEEYEKIAIVGTRRPTEYGRRVTRKFVLEAVGMNLVTVSGMAYGVDTDVHNFTLDQKGKTIAVLGTGIKNVYPAGNRYLYERIIDKGGLVISEYYNTNAYDKWVFPRRNRIIAGISENTIVIEARMKSGALVTADLAASYDRNVYVTPGSIFNQNSDGCNNAIKSLKAELITSIREIYPDKVVHSNELQDQKKILNTSDMLVEMGNADIL